MFVPHCSIVARPLLNLLRKNIEFKFESPEREAFERLKIILYSKLLLKLYRKSTESKLHTDACSWVMLQFCYNLIVKMAFSIRSIRRAED